MANRLTEAVDDARGDAGVDAHLGPVRPSRHPRGRRRGRGVRRRRLSPFAFAHHPLPHLGQEYPAPQPQKRLQAGCIEVDEVTKLYWSMPGGG